MSSEPAADRESGQGTVEWIGLVLLVSLLVAALGALAGVGPPGAELARALGAKLVCAASLGDECTGAGAGAGFEGSELVLAYGPEVAGLIARHVPDILYEEGTLDLPVDFRGCREDACATAPAVSGITGKSSAGHPATAFTHAVDCRANALAASEDAGADCSGEAAGKLFLQYWLYYPDSQTDPWGERGYHPDDWESFQVRIGGGETLARASSHHSYNYEGGPRNWASDAGIDPKQGWGPYLRTYHVSAGSHAGHVAGDDDAPRRTPAGALRLVPIEPVAEAHDHDELFEVTPPWLKRVYRDPDAEGT